MANIAKGTILELNDKTPKGTRKNQERHQLNLKVGAKRKRKKKKECETLTVPWL